MFNIEKDISANCWDFSKFFKIFQWFRAKIKISFNNFIFRNFQEFKFYLTYLLHNLVYSALNGEYYEINLSRQNSLSDNRYIHVVTISFELSNSSEPLTKQKKTDNITFPQKHLKLMPSSLLLCACCTNNIMTPPSVSRVGTDAIPS